MSCCTCVKKSGDSRQLMLTALHALRPKASLCGLAAVQLEKYEVVPNQIQEKIVGASQKVAA